MQCGSHPWLCSLAVVISCLACAGVVMVFRSCPFLCLASVLGLLGARHCEGARSPAHECVHRDLEALVDLTMGCLDRTWLSVSVERATLLAYRGIVYLCLLRQSLVSPWMRVICFVLEICTGMVKCPNVLYVSWTYMLLYYGIRCVWLLLFCTGHRQLCGDEALLRTWMVSPNLDGVMIGCIIGLDDCAA